jgi:nucleotide-binding universal stress UspA family protein
MTQPYRDSSPGPHRLLVATDFDPASEAALERSAALARDSNGSILLLCVLEALMYAPPDMAALAARDPSLHPEVTRHMEDAVRRLHELGIATVSARIEFGIAEDVIARYANSGKFDLLVLGSRGNGSTSAYVIPRVTIPVMVVPLLRA